MISIQVMHFLIFQLITSNSSSLIIFLRRFLMLQLQGKKFVWSVWLLAIAAGCNSSGVLIAADRYSSSSSLPPAQATPTPLSPFPCLPSYSSRCIPHTLLPPCSQSTAVYLWVVAREERRSRAAGSKLSIGSPEDEGSGLVLRMCLWAAALVRGELKVDEIVNIGDCVNRLIGFDLAGISLYNEIVDFIDSVVPRRYYCPGTQPAKDVLIPPRAVFTASCLSRRLEKGVHQPLRFYATCCAWLVGNDMPSGHFTSTIPKPSLNKPSGRAPRSGLSLSTKSPHGSTLIPIRIPRSGLEEHCWVAGVAAEGGRRLGHASYLSRPPTITAPRLASHGPIMAAYGVHISGSDMHAESAHCEASTGIQCCIQQQISELTWHQGFPRVPFRIIYGAGLRACLLLASLSLLPQHCLACLLCVVTGLGGEWNGALLCLVMTAGSVLVHVIPAPSYNWTRRGASLPRGAVISNYNRVLTIPHVQVEDQGEYVCRAANERAAIENVRVSHRSKINEYALHPDGAFNKPLHSWMSLRESTLPDSEREVVGFDALLAT
ncbi:hypothetical protein PR048_013041 [Dryococelus australis]|uniref:Ig-like domain-containing protein n=1 Tax=Dryococelus australis TaxID=614101 RepID=A0ABQ9HR28_9NEOP|nr:hypothetical protein PR048_013041 [Dryococelus australis]